MTVSYMAVRVTYLVTQFCRKRGLGKFCGLPDHIPAVLKGSAFCAEETCQLRPHMAPWFSR